MIYYRQANELKQSAACTVQYWITTTTRCGDKFLSRVNSSLSNASIPSLPGAGDTPGIRLLVLVEQRLNPLGLLELGELGWVGEAEEGGRELDQPLGVNGGDLAHVLLGGLDHLVEDDPLGLPVEQGRAGVYGHHL